MFACLRWICMALPDHNDAAQPECAIRTFVLSMRVYRPPLPLQRGAPFGGVSASPDQRKSCSTIFCEDGVYCRIRAGLMKFSGTWAIAGMTGASSGKGG